MNVVEALTAAMEGKHIRRTGWEKDVCASCKNGKFIIRRRKNTTVRIGLMLAATDLDAKDWEVREDF